MMTRKRLVLSLVAVVAFLSDAVAAIDLSCYPFVRDVGPITGREEVAAVTLDSTVWDAAGGWPEICIATADGTPVPHLLRKAVGRRHRTVRDRREASIAGLTEQPGNRIELSLQLADGEGDANLVEFVTPLRDFERQVSIHGIGPDGTGTSLVENALVYDYSRFADVRHVTVALPANTYRRFRVEIRDVTDEMQSPVRQITRTFAQARETGSTEQSVVTDRPFRMDAVRLWKEHEAESGAVESESVLALKSWQVREDARLRQSVIEIETFNEPLSGFVLQTPARNFSRRVTIEIPVRDSGVTETWRAIGSATLSRISFRDFQREELRISIPAQQARRLRLVLANDDNPPLEITGVEAAGPVWQAVFIAASDIPVRLYHGALLPRPAVRDTAPIERILASGFEPLTVPSGAPSTNPQYRKPGRTWSGLLGSRLFFIAAVAIMVAVLATALVRAVRRLDPPAAGQP
jgi:hypothetical protein